MVAAACAKPVATPEPEVPRAKPSASVTSEAIARPSPSVGTVARAEPDDISVPVVVNARRKLGPDVDRRDIAGVLGLSDLPKAGPTDVTVVVNMAAVRRHPVGARIGPVLLEFPGWTGFLNAGGDTAMIEPLRDADWLLAYGPSLDPSDRDIVLVRMGASDAVLDRAMDAAQRRYGKGGIADALPGVKATLGHSSGAERVFLRGQPHVLAVVPPDTAKTVGTMLLGKAIEPKLGQDEALRFLVREPHRHAMPGLRLPPELRTIQTWVLLHADGTGELFVEGDCSRAEHAVTAAGAIAKMIGRMNSGVVQMMTGGVLNDVKVEVDDGFVHVHVLASRAQLERMAGVVASFLGVELRP